MVCINVRHFIGFNRLWISFLSTSGLFWFYNLWKNMFNSESGAANLVYPVTLAGFICSYRSYPQAESCITYMARYVADPFQSLPAPLWNKGWIPPPTVCFFSEWVFFTHWRSVSLVLSAHLGSERLSSPTGCEVSKGVELVESGVMLCPILISFRDSLFCQPPIIFPSVFTQR